LIKNTKEFQSAERYVAPDIEIIDIALTQNLLTTGSLKDMPGENW